MSSEQSAANADIAQTQARQRYDFTPLTRPGANLNFFAWLFVIGLPLFLLFLIFSKHGM